MMYYIYIYLLSIDINWLPVYFIRTIFFAILSVCNIISKLFSFYETMLIKYIMYCWVLLYFTVETPKLGIHSNLYCSRLLFAIQHGLRHAMEKKVFSFHSLYDFIYHACSIFVHLRFPVPHRNGNPWRSRVPSRSSAAGRCLVNQRVMWDQQAHSMPFM